MSAKDIFIKLIDSRSANTVCKKHHYSGSIVNNSQLHFGVFYKGKCEGVLQFGPSTFKRKLCSIVTGCGMNNFIELNRMAFSDYLPRFSESRAIAFCHRLIKKKYPHIKFIVSFADATQCGDGAIYRASGYRLTQIKKNSGLVKCKRTGKVFSQVTLTKGKHILKTGKASIDKKNDYEVLKGFQLRYVYILDNKETLTCKEIPFDKIPDEVKMYKGVKRSELESKASDFQLEESGAVPTTTLQKSRDIPISEVSDV